MIALVLAGAVALLGTITGTPLLIHWLQAQGIGQQIREDGPSGHITKAGTPTMGGLMIVASATVGYLVGHVRAGSVFTRGGLLVMGVILSIAIVGAIDDWLQIRHQRSLGLSAGTKFAGQLIVAIAFAVLALTWVRPKTTLAFTRFDSLGLDLHQVGWAILAVLAISATSNAVNLTDGLDGLAAGSATFAYSAFAIIGFWQFRHFPEYEVPQALDFALVAVAMMGACTGFLWWNAAPARIFMGDTGSLPIGAGLAALAMLMNVHLLLPIIGGLFVLETLSVMVQVTAFRFFHRRVLRMAPIHHHFELLGWPETTVIIRFWILAGLCTALALALFYADFISLGALD